MKIKKIICMILVICLLGGLLTVGSSAAGWLYNAQAWLQNGLSNLGAQFQVAGAAIAAAITNNDFSLADAHLKVIPSSRSRVWTTTNCYFVGMDTMREYQKYFVTIGCSTVLDFLYDKNSNGAWFLRVTAFDDKENPGDTDKMYLTLTDKYVCALDDGSAAISSNRNYADSTDDSNGQFTYNDIGNYTENGDIIGSSETLYIYNNVESNNTTNNIFSFEQQYITEINNNTSYHLTDITYDIESNSYEFKYEKNNNEYVMNVEYHTQYTVVNYVDLQETYILYYELPDGRNSYDMTIEELSQYSTSFDVINYAASADNEDLLFLFPFNGNQENIAYNGTNFSYSPSLDWTTGNSITYQETSGFGAAMYLGNGDHTFDVTPDYQTNGNYTKYVLSFRYYYSPRTNATAVYYPLTVTVGGYGFSYDGYNDKFWIGRAFNSSTGAFNNTYSDDFSVAMPVGQWCDITLQYSFNDGGNKVYLFINGVEVGSYTDSLSVTNITPLFKIRNGDDGYSYIDELIGFKDIYFGSSVGEGFTPTLQPYDTNLILTLPSLQAVTVDSYVEDGKTYYYVYTPDQLWKPTIAVATDIHIMQYYLGGVRPSLPKRGYVWVPINGGLIGTVQVYDGSGWLEVASRVWTGSVWVESSSYSIYTNGTYNDLAGLPAPPVIADEQSFWEWCVEAFDTLIATIKSVGGGGGSVADPDVIPDIIYPGIDSEGNTTEESTSIFDIVTDIVGGIVDIIGEVVGLGGNVVEFFGDFFDGVGDAFGVLNPNNQNGLFYVEVE